MVRLNKWNREKLHFPILWFTDKSLYQGSSRIPKRGQNIGTLKPVVFVCGTKDNNCTTYGSACTIYLGGATGLATILWAVAHKASAEMGVAAAAGSQWSSVFYAGQTLHISHGGATLRDQYLYWAWGIGAGIPREPA